MSHKCGLPGGCGEFRAALATWLQRAQVIVDAYYTKNFPDQMHTLTLQEGTRYVRVVTALTKNPEIGQSLYCFIDKTTGAILYGSWKSPTMPRTPRGSIYTDQIGVDHHGALRLR